MSAAELVNIVSKISVFNELSDNSALLLEIVGVDHIEDVEEDRITETPQKLPEARDMLRKLHLLASAEQPSATCSSANLNQRSLKPILTGKYPNKVVSLTILKRIDDIAIVFNKL